MRHRVKLYCFEFIGILVLWDLVTLFYKIQWRCPMYSRILDIKPILKRKSIFLLGPRQTGKSTFIKQAFPKARYIDLLESDTYRELSTFPETLRQRLTDQDEILIIDEIQKLPSLLDEVQLLIDRNKNLRFILTGSSARKLRRGKANLLGGRALYLNFHPLVGPEVNYEKFMDRINWGGLPAIIDSPEPKQDLDAYVGTYLKEEIMAEGLTRSIENFSRVLHFSGFLNAQQVNYTKIANDAQVPARTVRDYFDILQDTLLASLLPCFQQTKKRKAVATEKFYFFDLGIARNLARQGLISAGTPAFGAALEHLVYLELKAFSDYYFLNAEITYWRSQSQFEVDFVVNSSIAIEVKAASRVSQQDLKGLIAFSEEVELQRKIIVCSETMRRNIDDTELIPFQEFFKDLWDGKILSKIPEP